MKQLFSTPKRAIITILCLVFFALMAVAGVVMGLASAGAIQ